MDDSFLCKDILGLIFSLLPARYAVFCRLCIEAKNLLKSLNMDGYDALIAQGVTVKITNFSIIWYKNGKIHRDNDLPAVIYEYSTEWYQFGELHRCGRPAVINRYMYGPRICGDMYYIYGVLHRSGDLPAVIDIKDNRLRWYNNGSLHRDNDLPAIIVPGCQLAYYKYGRETRYYDRPSSLLYGIHIPSKEMHLRWRRRGKEYRDGAANS